MKLAQVCAEVNDWFVARGYASEAIVLVVNRVGNLAVCIDIPEDPSYCGWIDIRTGESQGWDADLDEWITITSAQPVRMWSASLSRSTIGR